MDPETKAADTDAKATSAADSGGSGGKDAGGEGDHRAPPASLLDLASKGDDKATAADKAAETAADKTADAAMPFKLDEKPEWLADSFWDNKTKTILVEQMQKSQADFMRQARARPDAPPANPDGYEFKADEKLAPVEAALLSGTDDSLLKWFKQASHDLGISNERANKLYNGYLEQAAMLLPPPTNPKAEMEKLGPQGQAVVNAMAAVGENLMRAGAFDRDDFTEFAIACGTAGGVKMMQRLMEAHGAKPIPALIRETASATLTGEGLRKKIGELSIRARKGDQTAQAEWERLQKEYERVYGKGA